ncbi:hypothetical protein JOC78_000352 [Bacillus ectoiniformans]|uniref:PH domain-containing protein n=1 Tax=Bacillus ectoiniformans TaxID=1494429 RepID=UPI00195DF58D|nr:PH domain-containing protein [Bacillus ectoiniformans]MBM7647431.1 hypothetical protein [Bacillus ectoiniformans]
MKFKSKQDWWLTLIVWGAMFFSIGNGMYTLIEEPFSADMFFVLLVSIILPLFIIWMWLTTCYILDEHHLVVKFGPFKKKIPLESIKSVKKTMNPLSSPALSLKRLEIVYGDFQTVLISPEDREEFMKILSAKCPHVKVEKL